MTSALDLHARPNTIGHSILQAAQKWPDRTAFILGDRQASHAEFARQTIACARNLLALGIQPGEHIGILMPNSWEYAILVGAINMIGACAVVLNARYRGEDLQYVLRHAEITELFITGAARPHLDLRALLCSQFPELGKWRAGEELRVEAAPRLLSVFHFNARDEDKWPTEVEFEKGGLNISNEMLAERVAAVSPDDTAMIIFSSGTTAQPKACMISHGVVEEVAGAIAERLELAEEDVFWDPLPLYHLSSHLPLNACRLVGATFVCQTHFQAGPALEEIARTGATICYSAFPALTAAMIDHRDFKRHNLSRLRLMINIGAPDLLRKFAEAIPQATQIGCYGLTESGGISAMASPHDTLDQRVERVGKPLRTHRIRIVDPETLEELPTGVKGEIQIAGPLFSGYFKDEEQTAKTMLPGGWLRSGDTGWIDEDGQLAYGGRIKDMLKIGGENVAAVEVEGFLSRHPKIKMAQIIGAPDDRLVEVVAAYIELKFGETMSEAEVIEYCAGNIASYKVPRYVRFVTEWPMSATKIQKFKLSESFVPDGKIDVGAYMGKK
ncbi:class I adenylate-forming enzyme family protein [Novosphingobium sp. KN65.2]|uniref:class I adenylate-forming enzyme family protein n=1 Tax=Novosphingobium sp. KN65.2 TaxID=1478134 RepID=UPI0005DF5FD5|nr:AMP-binding protein [Novosphingobium sp. KN65.2]CDO36438.1 Long-chain-fatty-acid--CoA ligase [Novosphingobium sp. KN65.2]